MELARVHRRLDHAGEALAAARAAVTIDPYNPVLRERVAAFAIEAGDLDCLLPGHDLGGGVGGEDQGQACGDENEGCGERLLVSGACGASSKCHFRVPFLLPRSSLLRQQQGTAEGGVPAVNRFTGLGAFLFVLKKNGVVRGTELHSPPAVRGFPGTASSRR